MHAIGNALLGGATSSLCALNCDAFNVPLGAAKVDLSNKRLNSAAATLLAGVIKGNTTIISLKCVQPRSQHMVDQCLCLIQAPSLAVLASNSVSARFCKPPPWSVRFCVSAHIDAPHHHLRSRARSLSYTKLDSKGVAALAEGLKGNTTLQSLEYAACGSNRLPSVCLSVSAH